jgi:hypothetical protein
VRLRAPSTQRESDLLRPQRIAICGAQVRSRAPYFIDAFAELAELLRTVASSNAANLCRPYWLRGLATTFTEHKDGFDARDLETSFGVFLLMKRKALIGAQSRRYPCVSLSLSVGATLGRAWIKYGEDVIWGLRNPADPKYATSASKRQPKWSRRRRSW